MLASQFDACVGAVGNIWKGSVNMETLVILLDGHLCIVNIYLGAMTVHYRDVLL